MSPELFEKLLLNRFLQAYLNNNFEEIKDLQKLSWDPDVLMLGISVTNIRQQALNIIEKKSKRHVFKRINNY